MMYYVYTLARRVIKKGRVIINNRRNILYTCGLLDKIYNLRITDIKNSDTGANYISSEVTVEGEQVSIGLCTKDYQYHILSNQEILMMEMLLSWEALLQDDNSIEEESYIEIMLTDLDWIRNRKMRNKEYVQQVHNQYLNTIGELDNLLLIFDNEDELQKTNPTLNKLINIEYIYSEATAIGFKYNFGQLGNIVKTLNQRVSLDMNIFEFSIAEFMKYQILRYIVTSTFMCRVKNITFCRTHRSILQAITDHSTTLSYYDSIINSDYLNKYLKRYTKRLEEVMESLKACRFIKDYSIIPDVSKRGVITSCGKVIITVFKSNRKYLYKPVQKQSTKC